jgi:hypothetical protein
MKKMCGKFLKLKPEKDTVDIQMIINFCFKEKRLLVCNFGCFRVSQKILLSILNAKKHHVKLRFFHLLTTFMY